LFYSFTLFSPHILYLIYMSFFFLFTLPLPLISPLFPYTTLFRSFSSLTLVGYGNISNEVSDWKLENLSWESSIHLNNMVSIYIRSEEHTSELQSRFDLVCRLLLEKKKSKQKFK